MEKKKKFSLKSLLESNISLDSEEKGILRYLGNKKEESLNLHNIVEYLKTHGYSDLTVKDAREKMDYLIDLGYVRSKTTGKGENREEKFYLSRTPLGGRYKQKQIQGRGIIYDTSKLIQRLFASVFLLIGFGFIIYSISGITGAVISSGQSMAPTFVFAFLLFIIGGFLLKISFKKK